MPELPLRTQDVVQIVIEAEEAGVEYYRCLARNAREERIGEAFKKLTQQEERHVRELRRLRDSLAESQAGEEHGKERAAYLRGLARSRVFIDVAQCRVKAEEAASTIDAAGLALQFEKDVLLLLHELRRLVGSPEEETVDRLLWEETRHFRRVREIAEGEYP